MSVVLDVGGKPVDTLPYFNNEPFVTVAGGTGFIGSHVVQSLLENGYKIVCFSRGNRRGPHDDNIILNNNLIYLEYDLSSNALTQTLVESLRNCVAVVNLIGIKLERPGQTFENAHVGVVQQLIEISRKINARRFIHVSVLCARPDATSAYHDTKYRSEAIIKTSGIPYTILKPSVVYGRGDDMITSLAGVIRTSPVFPLIGTGSSLHQPIMVTDLAATLVACLANEKTIAKSYDLVGPTKVTLKEMVHIVADGMGLPTWSFTFPIVLHRIAAEVGTALLPNPPATPTQLRMLVDGMTGDSSQIRSDLDMPALCTTVLGPHVVQQLESHIPPIAGFSLRLFSSHSHYSWLESHRNILKSAQTLTLGAFSLIILFYLLFSGNSRVFLFYLAMGIAIIAVMAPQIRWRVELVQPPPPNVQLRHAAIGLACGLALCIYFKYILPVFLNVEGWGTFSDRFRTWRGVIFVLFFAIPTDEILWAASIGLPILARMTCGPQEHEKGELASGISRRGLGYLPLLGLATLYGIALSLLMNVSLFAPYHGLLMMTSVGVVMGVLTVKMEKLVAGVVCKMVVWLAMLFWAS